MVLEHDRNKDLISDHAIRLLVKRKERTLSPLQVNESLCAIRFYHLKALFSTRERKI